MCIVLQIMQPQFRNKQPRVFRVKPKQFQFTVILCNSKLKMSNESVIQWLLWVSVYHNCILFSRIYVFQYKLICWFHILSFIAYYTVLVWITVQELTIICDCLYSFVLYHVHVQLSYWHFEHVSIYRSCGIFFVIFIYKKKLHFRYI